MKPITLTIAYLLIAVLSANTNSFCQDRDTNPYIYSNLSLLEICLTTVDSATDIPINNISVLDVRFDPGMLGLFKSEYLVFGRKTEDEISRYLHASFRFEDSTKNSNSIYVYIKKLWLSNELLPLPIGVIKRNKHTSNWKPGIVFKVECLYKQQDEYYPLFHLDTIITTQKDLVENASWLLTACLEKLKEKIRSACVSFNSNGIKMKADQVSAYYSNRFNIPILTDTIYKKGLYETFAEFQNNRPHCVDFSVKIERLSDEVYLKDSVGNEMLVRNIWGYCDGKKLFIKSTDNYFELTRQANSFYLLGFKDIERWRVDPFGYPLGIDGYVLPGLSSPGLSKSARRFKYKINYKYYQLDMENGELL